MLPLVKKIHWPSRIRNNDRFLTKRTGNAEYLVFCSFSWWRQDTNTLSAFPALCEENPPITGGFPHKGPGMCGALGFYFVLAQTSYWTVSSYLWLGIPWSYLNINFRTLISDGNSHYNEKTVSRPSYLYNGNPMHGKTVLIVKRHPGLTLQWRHNGLDGVSNHQPHVCLLNGLFRHRLKKTSKPRVTGLCAGNSPVTGEFPAQRASNVENGSI